MTADLRAGIEALLARSLRGDGTYARAVYTIDAEDLDALLAAHPVQDEADASCNHERAAERLAHTTLLDRDSARVFLDGMAAMSDPAPVQVTTAEELDALPVGSVVLSKVGTIAARRDAEHGVCFGVDAQFPWADTLALPATLLYRPEVTP